MGVVRVYANVGVGHLHGQRWQDVDEGHELLAGWEAAGLVSRTGPRGEPPPAQLRQACCGAPAGTGAA